MAPFPAVARSIDWWGMLRAPEFLAHPYPELHRLREMAPVHFDSDSGVFYVLGHHEFGLLARSSDLGRDTRLWTNSWSTPEKRQRDPVGYALFSEFQPQMTNANPPDHRRMRAVYEQAFRPAYLARFRGRIEEECRRVLDTIPVARPFDFMTAFANVLPLRVSLRMFELPDEIESDLARWVAALSLIGNIFVTPKQKEDAHQALREFKVFLRGHLKQAGDDGFLAMARAALAEGLMDEEESLNNMVTLISGGTATQTLLGNRLLILLRHPDQLRALRTTPSLMESAVEEMLRYEPGGSFILRVAIRDVELDGMCIAAGAMAIGLMAAINRDPRVFASPDSFNIRRSPNPQLVFGAGSHICIGKEVVRMTGRIAFAMLLDRFPQMALAGEPVWWVDRSDQHGLDELPVQMS
jgi:cytochrome P450